MMKNSIFARLFVAWKTKTDPSLALGDAIITSPSFDMKRKLFIRGVAALGYVGIQALWAGPQACAMSTVEIVAKVKPCVVLIGLWNSSDAHKGGSLGTGFFIDDDKILTDAHVVSGHWNRIVVRDLDGKEIPVESQPLYINNDKNVDLAVLKVKGDGSHDHLDFATSTLQEGQTVTVIGNPAGMTGTVSNGILSAIRQNGDLLQFTAPISSGSSGGPVVNDDGQVIGIVDLAGSSSGHIIVENLNFAHGVRLMKIAVAGKQASFSALDANWNLISEQATISAVSYPVTSYLNYSSNRWDSSTFFTDELDKFYSLNHCTYAQASAMEKASMKNWMWSRVDIETLKIAVEVDQSSSEPVYRVTVPFEWSAGDKQGHTKDGHAVARAIVKGFPNGSAFLDYRITSIWNLHN
jgi:hypothetical protein